MKTGTWHFLLRYLEAAEMDAAGCFYTNVFVGLQPLRANGVMQAADAFYEECRLFLNEQVSIVCPRIVVALGQQAAAELDVIDPKVRSIRLLHPGNLVYRKTAEREFLIAQQGLQLKMAWLATGECHAPNKIEDLRERSSS